MAPTAALKKRPASAALAGSSPKKAAVAKEVDIRAQSCAAVASAVRKAELPEAVRGLFGSTALVKECFAVPKEERHKFQEEVVEMLTEILGGVEVALRATVADVEAKVAGADADRVAREEACAAATEAADAKKAAEQEAHAAATAAVDGTLAAREHLREAENAQKAAGVEEEAAASKKERLEVCKAGIYESLKAGTLEPEKTAGGVAELVALGKEFSFDNTLIQSIPSALEKAPDARGSFDMMALKQIEEEIDNKLAQFSETIANAAPSKATHAAAVATVAAEMETAERTQVEKKEQKAAAAAEKKEAVAAMSAATKAVKAWGPETKHLKDALAQATAAVEDFRTGPLAALKELEAFTKLPAAVAAEEADELANAEEVVDAQEAVEAHADGE